MTCCYGCKRFMNPSKPGSVWEACGEYGEDTRWVCATCASAPDFVPQASNGSSDPRWCGRVKKPKP
jgi:hypothetical protein